MGSGFCLLYGIIYGLLGGYHLLGHLPAVVSAACLGGITFCFSVLDSAVLGRSCHTCHLPACLEFWVDTCWNTGGYLPFCSGRFISLHLPESGNGCSTLDSTCLPACHACVPACLPFLPPGVPAPAWSASSFYLRHIDFVLPVLRYTGYLPFVLQLYQILPARFCLGGILPAACRLPAWVSPAGILLRSFLILPFGLFHYWVSTVLPACLPADTMGACRCSRGCLPFC